MGEEIIRRFLKQEVSPGGSPLFPAPGRGRMGAAAVVRGLLLATEPRTHSLGILVAPVTQPGLWVRCSAAGMWMRIHLPLLQSPEFLPEVGQPHASRCLQDLQKSPCKDLFSSCLR